MKWKWDCAIYLNDADPDVTNGWSKFSSVKWRSPKPLKMYENKIYDPFSTGSIAYPSKAGLRFEIYNIMLACIITMISMFLDFIFLPSSQQCPHRPHQWVNHQLPPSPPSPLCHTLNPNTRYNNKSPPQWLRRTKPYRPISSCLTTRRTFPSPWLSWKSNKVILSCLIISHIRILDFLYSIIYM